MEFEKVLDIDVSQPVKVNDIDMSLYQTARWCALLRGLDVISRKAVSLNIDLDTNKLWLKPLALQKYINEETPVAVVELKNLIDRDLKS